MFALAYDMDLIDRPVKFGKAFGKASKTQARKSRNRRELESGKRLFSPAEVRELVEAAETPLKAMILLGINGGFGNTDCADLPIGAVDLAHSRINFARPKTGIERVMPLWAETRDALCEAVAHRPACGAKGPAEPFFLTKFGHRWVRENVHRKEDGTIEKVVCMNAVGQDFNKLLIRLGFKRARIGFYTLRHTFRTWADEAKDQACGASDHGSRDHRYVRRVCRGDQLRASGRGHGLRSQPISVPGSWSRSIGPGTNWPLPEGRFAQPALPNQRQSLPIVPAAFARWACRRQRGVQPSGPQRGLAAPEGTMKRWVGSLRPAAEIQEGGSRSRRANWGYSPPANPPSGRSPLCRWPCRPRGPWHPVPPMPPAAGRSFREVTCEKLLNPTDIAGYSFNPYIGCEHACAYCYSRSSCWIATSHQEPWGDFVDVKIDAVEALARQVRLRPAGSNLHVPAPATASPVVARYRLTRRCCRMLLDAGFRLHVLTKAELVLRDLDIFAGQAVRLGVTITTPDEDQAGDGEAPGRVRHKYPRRSPIRHRHEGHQGLGPGRRSGPAAVATPALLVQGHGGLVLLSQVKIHVGCGVQDFEPDVHVGHGVRPLNLPGMLLSVYLAADC